jgi:hypothetical protein
MARPCMLSSRFCGNTDSNLIIFLRRASTSVGAFFVPILNCSEPSGCLDEMCSISESGSGWFILFIIEGGREHENSNYNRRK